MTHQQAQSVLAVPLRVVEKRLRDVPQWPQFMLGVEQVTEISFGRYTFVVQDGGRSRSVDVAVVAHPGEHRIVWHSLSGARFDGEIRLVAVDAQHTRVNLSLTAEPERLMAGLGDLVGRSMSTAVLDLQRLESLVLSPGVS